MNSPTFLEQSQSKFLGRSVLIARDSKIAKLEGMRPNKSQKYSSALILYDLQKS